MENMLIQCPIHFSCANQTYLTELPTVSVVVPFYNEHFSTLLRTCYSILNRSPRELLVEIILVDDASSKTFLGDELDRYLEEHMPIVRVIRLSERSGLIVARLAGAKAAIADVIVFLDSHVEVNTNWLPPLLGNVFSYSASTPIRAQFESFELIFQSSLKRAMITRAWE